MSEGYIANAHFDHQETSCNPCNCLATEARHPEAFMRPLAAAGHRHTLSVTSGGTPTILYRKDNQKQAMCRI